MTDEQLKALSDTDLDALRISILNEQGRRDALAAIPAQVGQLAAQFVAGGGEATTLTAAVTAATTDTTAS